MSGIGRPRYKAPRLDGLQTLLTHQPPHPMPSDDRLIAQLGGDPP